jgi:uncharacterized membrane protein
MSLSLAMPAWSELHPLVVHFPIALLLIAPLFVLIGTLWPRRTGLYFLGCALILMSVGTLAIFVSLSTGEASSKAVVQTPALASLIGQHEDLAEATAWVFLSLTAIFSAMLYGLALVQRKQESPLARSLPLIYLVLYVSGAVLLVQTAHRGGQLVHEFGVHANASGQASSAASLH